MINEKIEVTMKEGSKPLDEGMYQVELFDVQVEKRPTYDTRNKPKEEQITENTFKFHLVVLDKDTRGRWLFRNFVPAYFFIGSKGKNTLIQIVEAFIKRELTQEELYSFEGQKLNKLVGRQVVVGVKNNETGGKTYSNIEQFYKAKEEFTALTDKEKKEINEALVKADSDKKVQEFEPTSEKEAQTTDPDSVKYPSNRELPIIDADEDDIKIEDIPF